MVSMNAPPPNKEEMVNKWLSPQTLALAVSMFGMVLTAYIALDRRITGAEERIDALQKQRSEDIRRWETDRVEDATRWGRVETKLDKSLEREISRVESRHSSNY
jgi:hypothetical protein